MGTEQKIRDVVSSYDKAVERFGGNEGLFLRFLKKLPNDPTFQELKQAWEAGDFDAAERASHAIKGVAFNLGMDQVGEAAGSLVKMLRQRDAEAAGQYDLFVEIYRNAIAVIRSME